VAAANVDALKHFLSNGQKEQRRLVNPELMPNSSYRQQKHKRFSGILNLKSLKTKTTSFPLTFGRRHFSIDEYQSESANHEFPAFANEVISNPNKLYLDLGCGLRNRVHQNCLYLEVYPSLAADVIVEPTCVYPIESASLDGVGCFAVLEHTKQPWLVVQEIHRMIKPGGKVWIDWPFLQPVHGYPSHYFNATREGLESIFTDAGFKVNTSETGDHEGPDHTISWILGHFVQALPTALQNKVQAMTVGDLLRQTPRNEFWNELMRSIDDRTRSTFACGNNLVATKL
jgi:predicted SAM-dependent methyltransferase